MSSPKQHQRVFFLTLLAGSVMFFVASFFFPASVHAQIPDTGIVPQCDWVHGQTYGLGAFVLLASNVMKFIWGIAGSLALLMFVWGGFLWLTAAGEESRVKAGWDTFMNATIGILIVLGSWVIINTVILFAVAPGTFTVATLFGGTDSWVAIATNNSVCINSAQLARGYVPAPVAVTADCDAYCKEEATSRGGYTFIGVKGEACTPGTVDTTSGSAGYTKVCIKKGADVCNCEFMAASVAGTPNCGSYGGCVRGADDLFCEPTTNSCKERLGKDQKCRSPLVDRECANGLACRKDPGDSDYSCKEIAGATTAGFCCYNDVTAVSSGTGTAGSFTVKAQSGTMTKADCQGKRSTESAATLGHLGIYGLFCPTSVGVTSCGSKDDPYTTSGLATVEASSNSTRWNGLSGTAKSGCTLFIPDGRSADMP